jgi:hypothetical protein
MATAQQGPDVSQSRKEQLEVEKLSLEIAKLKQDRARSPEWLTGILGFLVGIVGASASVWVARRARLGELDQSVHDKRLELYPQLVKAAAPLAIYFPGKDSSTEALCPEDCITVGRAMSEWYFNGGGLLLSTEARDAYFRLARALTLASSARSLRVPTFPTDAKDISVEKLDEYRKRLEKELSLKKKLGLEKELGLDNVEEWDFGGPAKDDSNEHKFQDYVFLQRLASALRTTLVEDLGSRRRPSYSLKMVEESRRSFGRSP